MLDHSGKRVTSTETLSSHGSQERKKNQTMYINDLVLQ